MAKTVSFKVSQLSDLSTVVDYLSEDLKPNSLFLFDGPMAAGKTTLISEVLKKLNIQHVHSPTYALHHLYKGSHCQVHHFDLHRLTSTEEIESSGIWDFFNQVNDIFFIEWANIIEFQQWPFNFKIVQVEIIKNNDETRVVRITK